jgi:RNA polymerase sigma factor (sigma-70 family)
LRVADDDDTDTGGTGGGRFPPTHWSAVLAARSDDLAERSRALDLLIRAYWKPVYKYIRIRWNKPREDAQDLTQEFFARVIEKGFLDRYDPAKARLRTFVRVCVDGMVANDAKAAGRLKRGGEAVHLSLDFDSAETELGRAGAPFVTQSKAALLEIASPDSMEEFFEKEWVRSLFSLAVETLRGECERRGKQIHFRLFEIYDLEDSGGGRASYDDLARDFGIAISDVTNHLSFARREFRRIALEKLREVCASEDEFRREARAIFGIDPA